MSLDALPQTRAILERGREEGLHHGAQVFVSRGGKVVCDAAVGEARPGEKLTPNHLMLWLSAGKPVTALLVVRACLHWPDDEAPKLDDPVARHLPAFAANGKEGVTIRHLLTHTGGFPDADPAYPDVPWEESIRRLCAAPLAEGWVVGKTAGYHPKSSWFVLGELLKRWKEDPAPDGAADPLTFDERMYIQSPAFADLPGYWSFRSEYIATDRPTLAPMFRRTGRELVETDQLGDAHLTHASPGSSLRCRAADLGAFYRGLLDALRRHDDRLIQPAAAEALTARHRVGEFDRTLGHVVDFGLGVMVDSNRYGADTVPYGFGPHCSPRTFGHGGSQSSMAFCDPENELVVAWATNGMCGEPKHQRRNRAINAAIYEDLGLAATGGSAPSGRG